LTYGVSNRGISIRNIVFGLDVGVRTGRSEQADDRSKFKISSQRGTTRDDEPLPLSVRASQSKECGHVSISTGRNQDAAVTGCGPFMTTHCKSFVYIVRNVHRCRYSESVRFIAGDRDSHHAVRLHEVSVKSESALRLCIGVPINMGTV
jgi:hypothetical protein